MKLDKNTELYIKQDTTSVKKMIYNGTFWDQLREAELNSSEFGGHTNRHIHVPTEILLNRMLTQNIQENHDCSSFYDEYSAEDYTGQVIIDYMQEIADFMNEGYQPGKSNKLTLADDLTREKGNENSESQFKSLGKVLHKDKNNNIKMYDDAYGVIIVLQRQHRTDNNPTGVRLTTSYPYLLKNKPHEPMGIDLRQYAMETEIWGKASPEYKTKILHDTHPNSNCQLNVLKNNKMIFVVKNEKTSKITIEIDENKQKFVNIQFTPNNMTNRKKDRLTPETYAMLCERYPEQMEEFSYIEQVLNEQIPSYKPISTTETKNFKTKSKEDMKNETLFNETENSKKVLQTSKP